MKTLLIFDGKRLVELAPNRVPDSIVLPQNLRPNQITKLENGKSVLLFDAERAYFSTIGISPLRIGASQIDHITLQDSSARFTLIGNVLHMLEGADAYLNGRKIEAGDHTVQVGDLLWIGTTRIVFHQGYIECAGAHVTSRLNISPLTPETYEEFPIYKRSPRIIKREPDETIELNDPPAKQEIPKGELVRAILQPLITAAIMGTFGYLMGRGIFILMAVGMTTASAVFSVTNLISKRKARRKKEAAQAVAYDEYLLSKRKQIYEKLDAQRESLLYHNLSPKEIEREILSYSSRVYERSANDSDFLTLSLGYSTVGTSFQLKYKADGEAGVDDPLGDEMRSLAGKYQTVPNMPTVIDLKNAHLGLVGEKVYIHRTISSILAQLCFFQSYHDIEVILLTEEENRAKFEWARWCPHLKIKSINITGLVSAENQRDQVLGNVAQVLKMRKQKQEEEKKEARFLPHYVFIVDNPKLIINHSIMESLQTADTSLGFSMIYTTHIQSNLPEYVKTVFLLTGGEHATLLMDEGRLKNQPVILPDMSEIDLETMARKLAPLKHVQGVSTQIPETVTFFELFGVKRPEEIPVLELWQQNACHKSLAVPLGLRGRDDIVDLNLHEKAHGPHGLVAGTTGSGKSEIVQSYILSLAVNFHPHEVGFLLIDYKGGGMANLFADLPHLLGTITNLDGSESMRALTSIQSELKRRQRIFGEVGVNNINQYTKLFKAGEATLPLPHLFIISDEFAELKKEQPDFMAELVSTARIGRSLGVHLILATQKPTGVVDDQIWSNSKFKLALKVANEGDSNEVLKTPDAARITQPGRAYLQVGNNEIYELFQSAWSGAPYSEDVVERGFDSRVYLLNQLGQGVLLNEDLSVVDTSDDSKLTQLDVVVSHIHDLHEQLNPVIVARPWLPPLEKEIVTTAIETGHDVGQIAAYNLAVPLGMADIPEEQKQVEYIHNFPEDGNLAVFGSSGFGKSTLLMTTALTLASQNSPERLNFFILDYGNSALAQLRGLPHTADYLSLDDTEKLDKLMKLFTDALKERKSLFAKVNATNFRMYNEIASEPLPAIVLFIDNFDVIRELSQELEEFLVKLTRDGTGLGIYTAVSASRSGAVRYSVLNNFKNKIAQFLFDKSDVTALVGRSSYELPEVRGRALVKMADVHVMQCYLPAPYENDVSYATEIGQMISKIAENNTAGKASGIRVVADTVVYADLMPYLKIQEKQAVLGFDTESTEPMYLDFTIPNQLIVGAPLTGKTNLLRLILKQFEEITCFIADSRAEDLAEYADREHVHYMSKESELETFYEALLAEVSSRQAAFDASGLRVREFTASKPLILCLMDDVDNFIDLCKAKSTDMEKLVPQAMELGVRFVYTSLPSKLKGYDILTKILKEVQGGIALGNPTDQNLLAVQAPRNYKAIQDIGFWYKRGDVKQVKLPFVSE